MRSQNWVGSDNAFNLGSLPGSPLLGDRGRTAPSTFYILDIRTGIQGGLRICTGENGISSTEPLQLKSFTIP